MAFYRTTDTELTSIADAIRTKTGDSSPLVYPTGFVSAINQLEKSKQFNIMGDDLTLVNTIYDTSFSLDTTTYSQWTPSSTPTTLTTSTDLPTITVDGSYEYMLQVMGDIQFAYVAGASNNNKMFQYYINSICPLGRRASTQTNLFNHAPDTFVYLSNLWNSSTLASNSNGAMQNRIATAYGLYISTVTPTLSKQDTANPIITPKTPIVRAATTTVYMTESSFSELDPTNTIITITMKLYRCNTKNNFFNASLALSDNMCLEKNNISEE